MASLRARPCDLLIRSVSPPILRPLRSLRKARGTAQLRAGRKSTRVRTDRFQCTSRTPLRAGRKPTRIATRPFLHLLNQEFGKEKLFAKIVPPKWLGRSCMSTLSSVGATAPQSGQSISIVQIAMANSHVSFVHVFSALVPFHALITSLLEAMSALLAFQSCDTKMREELKQKYP